MKDFWMIYTPEGGITRTEFKSREDAVEEARRLLEKRGVTRVILLQSAGVVIPPRAFPVEVVSLADLEAA